MRADGDDTGGCGRKLFEEPKRRRCEINDWRRCQPDGEIADQAMAGGIALWCGGLAVTLAGLAAGVGCRLQRRQFACLATFARQRNDPTPVPGHNNVEPQHLNQ